MRRACREYMRRGLSPLLWNVSTWKKPTSPPNVKRGDSGQ